MAFEKKYCILFATAVIFFALGARSLVHAQVLRVHTTPHFQVSHCLSSGDAEVLGGLLEFLRSNYIEACRKAGFNIRLQPQRLSWICVDRPDAVEQYVARGPTDLPVDDEAYYSARENKVVLSLAGSEYSARGVKEDIWRISHEAAHQLAFNTGLQTRGVLYPVWLSEGLAANFELHSSRKTDFAAENPLRKRRLLQAHRQRRLLPLDTIVELPHAPDEKEKRLDLYAQAWGIVQFLFERDPHAFRKYLYMLSIRHPGRRPSAALRAEFVRVFGSIDAIQEDWEAYLQRLSEPAGGV